MEDCTVQGAGQQLQGMLRGGIENTDLKPDLESSTKGLYLIFIVGAGWERVENTDLEMGDTRSWILD